MSERIKKRTLTILGDMHFSKGDYHKALELYKRAGNFQKLRFHGRNFANKRYFAYAADYLYAAGCKLEDEKISEYMDSLFAKGMYHHTLEPLKIMKACDKLKCYAELCMKNGEIFMALIYYEAMGIKLTADMMTSNESERLIKDADENAKQGYSIKHVIEAYRVTEAYSKLMDLAIICLHRRELSYATQIFEMVTAERPLAPHLFDQYRIIAASFANRYLVQGDYNEGMRLYKAIGIRPDRSELVTCANMGFLGEPMWGKVFKNAMMAFRKAGATPSKKRIKEAGDYYLENHMIIDAIESYEAAEDTGSLWTIIKKYENKDYLSCVESGFIEDAAEAVAKIEGKIRKRKNK